MLGSNHPKAHALSISVGTHEVLEVKHLKLCMKHSKYKMTAQYVLVETSPSPLVGSTTPGKSLLCSCDCSVQLCDIASPELFSNSFHMNHQVVVVWSTK
jgi:hypothetical protein